MGKKFRNIIKMIKNDKRFKYTLVVTIMLLFISIIGYSLSFFNNNNSTLVANIKVNDLLFNMTTNSGESDDRILRLQAGKTESFYVKLKNLNSINAKYELKYSVCSDSNCTNTSLDLPNNVRIFVDSNVNGQITSENDNIVEIELFTINSSSNDVYIKLDLNAGYTWNELALDNQIELISSSGNNQNKVIDIIAYVDGIETEEYPRSCNYVTSIKGYNGDNEVPIPKSYLVCDRNTNTWKMVVDVLVKKVVINFTYKIGTPAFTFTGNYKIENEGTADWKIYFLTSGTLTFTEEPPRIDVFLVGGGGSGSITAWSNYDGASGGGGGYTTTANNIVVSISNEYAIVIGEGGARTTVGVGAGNDGKSSSAFGASAAGGKGGGNYAGGAGGSGGGNGEWREGKKAGPGGSDGSDGGPSEEQNPIGSRGQGTTTREFGESNGKLYAGGGGGSGLNVGISAKGGIGGGGDGSNDIGSDGTPNTGGGGGGSGRKAATGNVGSAGGSGIVVIRAHKEDL